MRRAVRAVAAVAVLALAVADACGVPSYAFHVEAADSGDAGADGGAPDAGACACVEAPPSGWTGPVVLLLAQGDGGDEAGAPACSGAYGVSVFTGSASLVVPPATCSPCTCAPPEHPACAGSIRAFCDQRIACPTIDLAPGACVKTSSTIEGCHDAGIGYVHDASTLASGSCTASVTVPTGGPVSLAAQARACAPGEPLPSAGCGGAQVCAPPVPSGGEATLCIETSGDEPCPSASPYVVQRVLYNGFADTRTCTACTCGAPSCNGAFRLFDGNGCTDGGGQALGGSCFHPASPPDYAMYTPEVACTPEGGVPEGGATGTNPTTFCCTP